MTSKLLCYGLIAFFLLVQISATPLAVHQEPTKEEQNMEKKQPLTFEEAWPQLQAAFNNLTSMAEGSTSYRVTSDAYMSYYTIVYETCVSNPVDNSPRFYGAYKRSFEDYISSKIQPSLKQARNEDFLVNLVRSWTNYKLVTSWFWRFLNWLDRYYVRRSSLPSLVQTSYSCFFDKVYGQMNDQIIATMVALIDLERKGNQIDQKLLKNVLDIYVEMTESSMTYAHYTTEFEEAMLGDAANFYSNKALEWASTTISDEHYTEKVAECLEQERSRVSSYLQETTMDRL